MSLGNGQNFVAARAGDSPLFKSVTITTNGAFGDLRQLHLGGVSNLATRLPVDVARPAGGGTGDVPEPATRAMLVVGLGMVGAMRRRRQAVVAA